MATLSEAEIQQAVNLLSKLEPGLLPFDIFHQVARLCVLSNVEIVPFRLTASGKIEVLLIQRPADDPVWPSQLHTPGTMFRPTDTPGSFQSAIDRIFTEELGVASVPLHFVQNMLIQYKRGMVAGHLYWIELLSQPTEGEFYDADNLPDTTVQDQLEFITLAVDDFKRAKSLL